MSSVHETRSLWRRSRFVWGRTDCAMSVCRHVQSVTGIDPLADLRGKYSDEAGAQAIIDMHGDLLGLMRCYMAAAGFAMGNPAEGRPVVCDVRGVQITGLCMGSRIGFMAERGYVETRADVLGAWII